MNGFKTIILWLTFIFAFFLPASALTLTAPETRVWEIFSIGYDAHVAEANVGVGVVAKLGKEALIAREATQVVNATVQLKRASGLAAEAKAAEELVAEGNTILGSQVAAKTSAGLRGIDHLIQTKSGQVLAIEVKAGEVG